MEIPGICRRKKPAENLRGPLSGRFTRIRSGAILEKMTRVDEERRAMVKELLEGISDEQVKDMCIDALRSWRSKHPAEGMFSVHAALGLEVVPLLLAHKRLDPVDRDTLSRLKEPFITEQNEPWFVGVSDFLGWFIRSGYGDATLRDKHNIISVRLTRSGMTFLDAAEGPGSSSMVIPGYEIMEALPAGASGEVYRAKENRNGGIERAIKVFLPHPFADEQDPEPRFRSEVEALLRLQHRAIVRYVHSGVLASPRAFYLVMEFVNGARLSARYPMMPYETRVSTIIEILDGLEHAHQSKIYHRDIKPSNIMIRDSDQQAVLVDFGLAYLVGDERDDDRTRTVLGTPGYIPPEAANDPKRSRDPRHDVFQAGVTLYEIIMGHLPKDSYLSLEIADPRLRELDPVLRRAMAADPASRFPSAAAFAGALRDWLERNVRLRNIPRSPITERLRNSLATQLTMEANNQRIRDSQEQELRTALRPLAVTVETLAIDAFGELYDSIRDLAPYITLGNIDLSSIQGAEQERKNGGLVSPLVRFTFSNIDRIIAFSRVRPGTDLWNATTKQIREFGTLKESGQSIELVWNIWTGGKAQTPDQIVWGTIVIDVKKPTLELSIVGLHRQMLKPVELRDEASIKDHILESLGKALHLGH